MALIVLALRLAVRHMATDCLDVDVDVDAHIRSGRLLFTAAI